MKISIKGIEYKFPQVNMRNVTDKFPIHSSGEMSDASALPALSLENSSPEDILAYIRSAQLPFAERLSGFMKAGCEKVIFNCMNGFCECDTEKIIGGAKILLLALKVRKGEFALDISDKSGIDAISPKIQKSEMLSCVKLPSLFPIANNRLLSFCMYPYTKRKSVAVFSTHELISLYNAVIGGRIYDGSTVRLVYKGKYFDTFIPNDCTVSEIMKFASDCFCARLSWVRPGVSGLGTKLPCHSTIPYDICALSFGTDTDKNKEKESDCSGCTVCRQVCPFSINPDLLMLVGNRASPELERCALCGLCDEFCPSGIRISEKIAAKTAQNKSKRRKKKLSEKSSDESLTSTEEDSQRLVWEEKISYE